MWIHIHEFTCYCICAGIQYSRSYLVSNNWAEINHIAKCSMLSRLRRILPRPSAGPAWQVPIMRLVGWLTPYSGLRVCPGKSINRCRFLFFGEPPGEPMDTWSMGRFVFNSDGDISRLLCQRVTYRNGDAYIKSVVLTLFFENSFWLTLPQRIQKICTCIHNCRYRTSLCFLPKGDTTWQIRNYAMIRLWFIKRYRINCR